MFPSPVEAANRAPNFPKIKDPPHWVILLLYLIISILCLFALLALQIIGVVKSLTAYFNQHSPDETWCSPAFQIADRVFDYHCTNYTVDQRAAFGIGCVDVPTEDFAHWLFWTGVGLIIEIVGQMVDLFLLIKIGRKVDVKPYLKRPWFTMVTGLSVLLVLVVVGWYKTQHQPMPTGPFVGLVTTNGSCASAVYPGGLRGSIIAWSDGVFAGLGELYTGWES